jgi:MYXO-CTERM domain-containing protein
MPYPGHLCSGKSVGDACSYQSSRGTCVPDPNPPQSCTGNDAAGKLCIWCEFDPNSEEAGCSVAGGASVSGMLTLLALVAFSLARRRRRR